MRFGGVLRIHFFVFILVIYNESLLIKGFNQFIIYNFCNILFPLNPITYSKVLKDTIRLQNAFHQFTLHISEKQFLISL